MLGLSLGVPFKGMVSAAPAVDTTSFITTWTATSAELLKPSTNSGGTYSGTIQWEELGGTVLSGPTAFSGYNDSNLGYTTAGAGTVRCRISGTFSQFDAYNNHNAGTPSKIKAVEQLGKVGWTTMIDAFRASAIETFYAGGAACDTTGVTGISSWGRLFRDCASLVSLDFDGMYIGGSDPTFFTFAYICNSLESCSFVGLTGIVDGMAHGLRDCPSLVSVDFGGPVDVSNLIAGLGGLTGPFITYALPKAVYDQMLSDWAASVAANGTNAVRCECFLSKYSNSTDHDYLAAQGWIFSDGGYEA